MLAIESPNTDIVIPMANNTSCLVEIVVFKSERITNTNPTIKSILPNKIIANLRQRSVQSLGYLTFVRLHNQHYHYCICEALQIHKCN